MSSSTDSFTLTPVPEEAKPFIRTCRADAALQTAGIGIEHLSDLEIAKFWIGYHKDEKVAQAKLASTLKWRADYNLAGTLTEDFSDIHAIGKFYPLLKPSQLGLTILVWHPRLHNPDAKQLERLIRFFVSVVYGNWKKGVASDKIIVLVEQTGTESKNRDIAMVKQLATVFNENFPETLDSCFCFPSGWLMTTFWAAVKLFLDPVTADKVSFINEEDIPDVLAEITTPGNLPVALGGEWEGAPTSPKC
ncbi:CRAL-TRIO domain-containing protein [Blastocladiella britannica]|nr:CRAL-TRIO domain-containing protein [Blastocladiella britannica]